MKNEIKERKWKGKEININSLRLDLILWKISCGRNVDIILLSEMKPDDSFPSAQFKVDGFSAPFSLTGTTLHWEYIV